MPMQLDPHTSITTRPIAELTSAEAAAANEHCFEDYIVPIRAPVELWERRFRSEHLDPFASRVYEVDGRIVALLLITRRGWTSRVGSMAVAKEMRGRGLGRRVMTEAIADARARGDQALLLEVIEQNTPAVNLYASLGFQRVRRLVGWSWTPPTPPAEADALQEIDPLELSRILHREAEPGLPWMLAPETIAAVTRPVRTFALEDRAYALVPNSQAETLGLPSLVVPRAYRRQGWGTRMLGALAAAFPGKPWQIAAIVPEGLGAEFLTHTGWERTPLTQFDMRLDL